MSHSQRNDVDWTFAGTWPFRPRFLATEDGRLHYVDEGPGGAAPVLLLDGNPTWVYLFRNLIPHLVAAGHRVIAADQLGFGRSDKPADPERYQLEAHARRLDQLLAVLGARDVTVIAHDWGAAIGLLWAVRHPDRVSRLVILNAAAPADPGRQRMVNLLRIVRAPLLGELLVQGLNVLIHLFALRVGVAAGDRLTTEVRRAYLAPNPTWLSRTALLAFPRQVPLQKDRPISALFHEIDDGLRRHFRDKPTLICWAERDRLLSSDVLHQWLVTLPDAHVVRFPNAGHFLQEDAPDELASTLVGFLGSPGCPRMGGTGPREFW